MIKEEWKLLVILLIKNCFYTNGEVREKSEVQLSQMMKEKIFIDWGFELLKEIQDEFIEIQLSILLKRSVCKWWNEFESYQQLNIIDNLFPLICIKSNIVSKKQLIEIVKFVYSKSIYPNEVSWLLQNKNQFGESVLLIFKTLFKLYRFSPETNSYSLFDLFQTLNIDLVQSITTSQLNQENILSILCSVTFLQINNKMVQFIYQWLIILPDILKTTTISPKGIKYLFRFVNNTFAPFEHYQFEKEFPLFVRQKMIEMIQIGCFILFKQPPNTICFEILQFFTKTIKIDISYEFMLKNIELILNCIIPLLCFNEDDLTCFSNDQILFLQRENDRKYGSVDAYTAANKYFIQFCSYEKSTQLVVQKLFEFLNNSSFKSKEGCCVLFHFINGSVQNKTNGFVGDIKKYVILPLLSSKDQIQNYYGVLLFEDYCSKQLNLFSSMEEAIKNESFKLVIPRLFELIQLPSVVIAQHIIASLQHIIKILPLPYIELLYNRILQLLQYPSFQIINSLLTIYLHYPQFKPSSTIVVNKLSLFCLELTSFHLSLSLEQNPNLDLMSELLNLLYLTLEALEKFLIYSTDLSVVFKMVDSILQTKGPLISDISEQLLSIVKSLLKLTHQTQPISVPIQNFLLQNPLDSSILLLPSIGVISRYSISDLNHNFLLQYIQNAFQSYYNDDYLFLNITFTVKELIIHSLFRPELILPSVISLIPRCSTYLAHCLKTTLFVSVIFQPQPTLHYFETINYFDAFYSLLQHYSTIKTDFYSTKIIVLTLITLMDAQLPSNQLAPFQLLIHFLQTLYSQRTTYTKVLIEIEEEEDEYPTEIEEESIPSLIELNDNMILKQLIQKLSQRDSTILKSLNPEQTTFLQTIIH